MDEIVGGEFTVTVKLVDALWPRPSETVSVIVETPLCPGNGTIVTERAADVPLINRNDVGTNATLLDTPVTDNEVTGTALPPTVKASADEAIPIARF